MNNMLKYTKMLGNYILLCTKKAWVYSYPI